MLCYRLTDDEMCAIVKTAPLKGGSFCHESKKDLKDEKDLGGVDWFFDDCCFFDRKF